MNHKESNCYIWGMDGHLCACRDIYESIGDSKLMTYKMKYEEGNLVCKKE